MIYIILATIIALCAGLLVIDVLEWHTKLIRHISIYGICACELGMVISIILTGIL